jgi:hypothetical protein
MNKHLFRLLVLASVFVTAGWGTVIVSFGSDTVNEWNNQTGNNVVINNTHPVWATLPPYKWVSYANTGTGPGAISPPNATIPGTPTAIFQELLPLLTAKVWVTVFADDTADVYLFDNANPFGLLLKAANPFQDSYCAAGPIGCEATEGWTSPWVFVDPTGPAWLEFRAYQRAGGPFGVLYGGEAELAPEPGTYAFLGTGLIALGLLRRLRSGSARNQ